MVNILLQQGARIHRNTVFVDRKVQVGAGAEAGAAYVAYPVAGVDVGPGLNADNAHVGVKGAVPRMMADYHIVAVGIVPAHDADPAGHGGPDGKAVTRGDVHARVKMPAARDGADTVAVGRTDVTPDGPVKEVAVNFLKAYRFKPCAGDKEGDVCFKLRGKKLVRRLELLLGGLVFFRQSRQCIAVFDGVHNAVLIGNL